MRVDARLLQSVNRDLGDRAVKLLTARLVCIATVVPDKSLALWRLADLPAW